MHLAVDARVVAQDARGIGRYERAVLRRLLAADRVKLTLLLPELLPSLRKSALAAALDSENFSVRSKVPGDADLVWHPANGTFFKSTAPNVATIHDAVPFRFPADDARKRAHDQEPLVRSAKTARRVVAVSQFGAGEIEAVLAVPRSRIEVIYHGVDSTFAPGDPQALPAGLAPKSYWLFVGSTDEPRKNFARAYLALNEAYPFGSAPPLVVAGARAHDAPNVVAVGELGDDLRSRDNDRLRDLYRGAIGLLVPSFHETFGMPVIEAMACGTPVIAANASCLPEIGGDAALYADPHDEAPWAEAIRRLSGDPSLQSTLRERGLARASGFSWERSTAQHLSLFERVANER